MMKITKNTRISTLIKENKKTIDTIASINKNFLKLKNPILRKVLAPRVTVADAAKVGGVTIEVLVKKLEKIGFEFDGDSNVISKEETQKISKELAGNLKGFEDLVTFDVRPIIESGEDPFKEIMVVVKTLKEGQILQIINSFEPIPLIRKLESKGFESWTERPEEGAVHTFFKKNASKYIENDIEEEVKKTKIDFDEQLKYIGDNLKKIDVRDLEMPEPMVMVLKEIETLKEGQALYVDHKKIPQFLLPELEQRNFEVVYKEIDCNHTLLLIYKD